MYDTNCITNKLMLYIILYMYVYAYGHRYVYTPIGVDICIVCVYMKLDLNVYLFIYLISVIKYDDEKLNHYITNEVSVYNGFSEGKCAYMRTYMRYIEMYTITLYLIICISTI